MDKLHEEGLGRRRDWEQGVVGLRTLGQVAVLACFGVWREAARLWGEKKKQEQDEEYLRTRTHGIAAGSVAE